MVFKINVSWIEGQLFQRWKEVDYDIKEMAPSKLAGQPSVCRLEFQMQKGPLNCRLIQWTLALEDRR